MSNWTALIFLEIYSEIKSGHVDLYFEAKGKQLQLLKIMLHSS